MEKPNLQPVKETKKKIKKGVMLKKIDADTARALNQFKDRVNKKTFGRKVRDNEIIATAIALLTDEHIAPLQQATYSEQDRLRIAFEKHQRINGKATMGDFVLKLLERAEV